MRKVKMKGLSKAETAYAVDGLTVVVKISKDVSMPNMVALFASGRLVGSDGETVLEVPACTYGIGKEGLTKEILRETVETATQEQVERVLKEKEILELLDGIPGETDD